MLLTFCLELQLDNPEMVEGLVLINVNPCAEGWMDWAASKVRLGVRVRGQGRDWGQGQAGGTGVLTQTPPTFLLPTPSEKAVFLCLE